MVEIRKIFQLIKRMMVPARPPLNSPLLTTNKCSLRRQQEFQTGYLSFKDDLYQSVANWTSADSDRTQQKLPPSQTGPATGNNACVIRPIRTTRMSSDRCSSLRRSVCPPRSPRPRRYCPVTRRRCAGRRPPSRRYCSAA